MLSHSKKVERYIQSAPAKERFILEKVRALILRTLPDVDEIFKYNVPYYDPICYMRRRAEGVLVSFCFGALLPKKYGLRGEKGRLLAHYNILSVSDIKPRRLQELLRAAYRKRAMSKIARQVYMRNISAKQ